MNRRLIPILLAGLALTAATGHARLGENLAQLRERFGKPENQPRKDAAVWLFDGEGGRLVFTVTFNAKGESIAEGLKPLKHTLFTAQLAQGFIDSQTEPYRDSKTARQPKAGEKYTFAGKEFTCAEQEFVIVDEPKNMLLIWTRAGLPSIVIVSREMLK